MKHLSTLLLAIVSLIMAHHPSVAQTGTPSAAPPSATALSPPNKNLPPHKAGKFVAGNRQIKSIQRSSFVNVSSANVIDFENVPTTYYFRDGNQNLGHYYPGVSFGPDVTVLDKVIYGYVSAYYPPHSGNCVIVSPSHDTFYMTFDSPTNHVSFWYTALYGGTATAYLSGGGTEVLPLSKNIGSNTQLVFSSSNIASIAISADANYFSLDDLSFDGSGGDQLAVTDTNNKPVVGIVCDNLRGMRSDLLDDLTITLPPTYANATVTGTVDGNVGRIVSGTGRVTYYPPDEYNEVQEPRDPVAHPEDFTKAAIRPVTLHLTANNQPFTQTIYIARPTVVLVHGINNSPWDWLTFEARVTTNPDPSNPNSGLGVDMPFVTVNHNNPSSYSATYGNLWNGNGPVEIAADLLAKRIQRTLDQLHDALPFQDETDTNSPDSSFGYSFTLDTQGKPVHLAARRVDVVGWSYGGVITRWYIASGGDQSNAWYQGASYKAKFAGGLPKVAYNRNIRKFITLGSMWRGVPLVNYLNEVQFPSTSAVALAQAPINTGFAYVADFLNDIVVAPSQVSNVNDIVSSVNTLIQVHLPSMEVMAINSPWQSQMVYQDPFQNKVGPPYPRPFDDDIAYGSVAGDNNAYTKTHGFDPYELLDLTTLKAFSPRSPFPYLRLEYRLSAQRNYLSAQRNYTDGIVPLWSSAIPGSYKIAPTDHSGYKANTDTINYVVQWLNNAALPQGASLENQWNTSIQSYPDNGQVKTWAFSPAEMAPHTESLLYPQINGIGRINPTALQGTNTRNPTVNISRLGSTNFGTDNFSFVLAISDSGASAHDFSIVDVSYYTVGLSPLPLGYYTIKPLGQPVGSIDFLGPRQFLTVNAHKGSDVSNLFCRVSIQYKDQNENLITPQPRTIQLK